MRTVFEEKHSLRVAKCNGWLVICDSVSPQTTERLNAYQSIGAKIRTDAQLKVFSENYSYSQINVGTKPANT